MQVIIGEHKTRGNRLAGFGIKKRGWSNPLRGVIAYVAAAVFCPQAIYFSLVRASGLVGFRNVRCVNTIIYLSVYGDRVREKSPVFSCLEYLEWGAGSKVKNKHISLFIGIAAISFRKISRPGPKKSKPLILNLDNRRVRSGKPKLSGRVSIFPEEFWVIRNRDVQGKVGRPKCPGFASASKIVSHSYRFSSQSHPSNEDGTPAVWVIGIRGKYFDISIPGLQVNIIDMGIIWISQPFQVGKQIVRYIRPEFFSQVGSQNRGWW